MAQGKRAGTRKGSKTKAGFQPALLALALGVTAAVVAWGYLVLAAIDFGSEARGGDSGAWAFLGLASLGAVACLFLGFLLVARLLRRLGITQAPTPHAPVVEDDLAAPLPPGAPGALVLLALLAGGGLPAEVGVWRPLRRSLGRDSFTGRPVKLSVGR